MRVPVRTILRRTPWVCSTCKSRALSTIPKRDAPERRPSQRLPQSPARTRFAPSPTGYLHLGSLRTALFNYLTARATGGQFILRLEDTDRKRTVDDAESRLYEDFRWAGLQWDEGPDVGGPFGPYKQSLRTSLYQKHAAELLESGHSYRCFCSAERLNNLAYERNKLGLPSDYDRACGNIPREESDERAAKRESFVIRLKAPNVPPQYTDLVYGKIGQRKGIPKRHSQSAQPSYEDSVLMKSDGLPTYHLANVVDDHEMGITHVIRAIEWMSSTPKHMAIYNALNWEPPTFAHVGLLQDSSLQKLSKRDSSLDIRSFRNDGIFPEALINYVALFGWSHRLGDDFLSLQDLIKNFDMKFTKGNTIASPTKLRHLQKRYAQKYINEGREKYDLMIAKVVKFAQEYLEAHPESRFCPNDQLKQRAAALLQLENPQYTTPREFFERHSQFFCFDRRQEYAPQPDDQPSRDRMDDIRNSFERVPPEEWDEPVLVQTFVRLIEELSKDWNRGFNQSTDPLKECGNAVQKFLRWALVGGRHGPVLMVTMALLGREVSLYRINDAIASFHSEGDEMG